MTIIYSTNTLVSKNEGSGKHPKICHRILNCEHMRLPEILFLDEFILRMRRFFGGRKKKESTEDTVLKLQKRSSALEEQIAGLNSRLAELAKQAKSGNKPDQAKKKGVSLLKKRKILEQNLQRVENQMFNLEMLKLQKEQLESDAEVAKSTKAAAKAIREMQEESGEDAILDLQELIEDNEEISSILGADWGPVVVDEEEVETAVDTQDINDIIREHENEYDYDYEYDTDLDISDLDDVDMFALWYN